MHDLRLEHADDGFGQRIIVGVTARIYSSFDAGVGEALGE